MDQLCINQLDSKEKNQEVPKMGQYYGNATATLIAINTNATSAMDRENKLEFVVMALKKVVNSQ
jgi:hypothetical protein